jgi:hypothetical protein
LFLACVAGCQNHAALPEATVTFEHQRLLHAPSSAAWQAAVATASRHGIIRVSDQNSGLLTFIYKEGPRRFYCNFLLHAGPAPDTTYLTVDIFDPLNQKIPDAALQLLPELQGRAESLRGATP